MLWWRKGFRAKPSVPARHRVLVGGIGLRQALATVLKNLKNPSAPLNDIQEPKKSPLPSNAVIPTGWLINLAIEAPRPNAGMLGLGDKLSFNDERTCTAI